MYAQIDRSVFKKDILDRIKLKNRKREFKASPESKEKIVTVIKITKKAMNSNNNRFQFRKQDNTQATINLEKYAEIMKKYPYMVNPKIKTLWLPVTSSNRTATFNLNHAVEEFTNEGYLIGENGNCCTPYIIIIVPNCWNENTLTTLANMVKKEIDETSEYEAIRFLTPSRIDLIEKFALLIGNNP